MHGDAHHMGARMIAVIVRSSAGGMVRMPLIGGQCMSDKSFHVGVRRQHHTGGEGGKHQYGGEQANHEWYVSRVRKIWQITPGTPMVQGARPPAAIPTRGRLRPWRAAEGRARVRRAHDRIRA